MKNLFLPLLLLLIVSCTKTKTVSNLEKIAIDISIAKEYYLDEVSTDVKIFALKADSNLIGDVTHIKSYGEYTFLFDGNNMVIHAFDANLKYVNTLNKHGRSREEYLGFLTFAYNEQKKELSVFDRSYKEFISYTMPDFKYVGRKKYDGYIMAMEFMSSNVLFSVKEADFEDIPGAMELLDFSKDSISIIHSMEIGYVSAELSPDQTVTRVASDSVFYCSPNYINTVYRITETEFLPMQQIDFGKENMPERHWTVDSDSDLDLGEELSDREFAIMPQYSLMGNGGAFSCWYITQPSTNQMSLPKTMCYNQNTHGDKRVISSLKLHDIDDIELQSRGIINGYYASLVFPEEVNTKQSSSEISTKIIELSKNKNSVILVLYKLN